LADESDDLFLKDFFRNSWGPNSRVTLPRTNFFEEFDDRTSKERFRLSKTTVLHLLSEVYTEYAC